MAKKKHVYHISASKRREIKRREFYEAHKSVIIKASIAAVIAIVVLIAAIDFFATPGGSMRLFMGNLIGAKETSIIREIKDGRFYTLADMQQPEGYASETYDLAATMEKNAQYRYFVDQTGEKAIKSVYVTGVKGRTGEDMISTLATNSYYEINGGAKTAEIAGHTVNYLYAQNNINTPTSEDEELPDEYFATLIAYVNSIQDSCVLVSCNSAEGIPQAELPTEEAMVAELEAILGCLTVPAK